MQEYQAEVGGSSSTANSPSLLDWLRNSQVRSALHACDAIVVGPIVTLHGVELWRPQLREQTQAIAALVSVFGDGRGGEDPPVGASDPAAAARSVEMPQ